MTLQRSGTSSGTLSPCTELAREQYHGHQAVHVTKSPTMVTLEADLAVERLMLLFSSAHSTVNPAALLTTERHITSIRSPSTLVTSMFSYYRAYERAVLESGSSPAPR